MKVQAIGQTVAFPVPAGISHKSKLGQVFMLSRNTSPIIRIAALLVLIFVFKGAGNGFAGSLSISWTPIQDSLLAGYKIKFGTTSGIYSQSVNVGNVTSYVVPNLTDGTTYYLIVVGYDTSQVEGQASTEVSGAVLASTAVAASSITANGAVIIWTTNKPGDSQTDYGTTTTYDASTSLDPTLVTSHSQSLANLNAGTTYNYRIRSKDAGGSVTVSSNFSFTTQQGPDTTPPGDATNFTAVPGNTIINLNWTNPTDPDYKGVMIRYRTDGVYPTSNADGMLAMDRVEVAGSNDYFVHSGLSNGTTYSYSAFTYDTTGNYSHTAHIQATPANLSITSISPIKGLTGTTVVISGTGFGTAQGSSKVTFNGLTATASAWSDTSITVTVPQNAKSGNVVVTVNGVQTNGVYFKVGNGVGKPPKVRVF